MLVSLHRKKQFILISYYLDFLDSIEFQSDSMETLSEMIILFSVFAHEKMKTRPLCATSLSSSVSVSFMHMVNSLLFPFMKMFLRCGVFSTRIRSHLVRNARTGLSTIQISSTLSTHIPTQVFRLFPDTDK